MRKKKILRKCHISIMEKSETFYFIVKECTCHYHTMYKIIGGDGGVFNKKLIKVFFANLVHLLAQLHLLLLHE